MKHILIIASYGPSLINFRLPLIKKLLSRGYKVSVASPNDEFSENLKKKLKDLEVNINIFILSRQSLNIIKDFKSLLEIYKIIRNTKPNIIISYTAKPVIYTGLVLRLFKKTICSRSFLLVSFQLLICNAIRIPITTRIISPMAYFKYFPVLFFFIRS